jgi:hypothetical protein
MKCGLPLLAVSAIASAATPLACPKGTRLESRNNGTWEFCVDAATGLKEGPERQSRPNGSLEGEGTNHAGKREGVARVYGDDGTLMAEMHYEKGEMKSMHMTLAGLRYQTDKQNARYVAASKPYHLSVIDERTLVLDVKVASETPPGPDETKRFHDQFRGDPDVCRIFPGLGIDAIQFRILTAKATQIAKFTLTAAECGAKQSAN